MRRFQNMSVLLLIGGVGCGGAMDGSATGSKVEQALECQDGLAACVVACRPAEELPRCGKKLRECLAANPNDRQDCYDAMETCVADVQAQRVAVRACFWSCRSQFQGCAGGCQGGGGQGGGSGLDPYVEACLNNASTCLGTCQQSMDACIVSALQALQTWLESLANQYDFCLAQAGGNMQMLIDCMRGSLEAGPEFDLSCVQESGACFATCGTELADCIHQGP